MIIMAVDPATTVTGWAVIEVEDGAVVASESGFIDASRHAVKKPIGYRLDYTYRVLKSVADKHPDIASMAIEAGFVGGNNATSLVIGYARAVVYMLAAALDIPVSDYTATSVKKAVTGNGHSTKNLVQAAVRGLMGINVKLDMNESDALAVGLTHLGRTGDWDRMRNFIDNEQIEMPRGPYAI